MTLPIKTCIKCGNTFELHPQKHGRANECPECSPTGRLNPKEAKDAALERKGKTYDSLFRNAIDEKRQAQAQGLKSAANKSEEEILMWDKSRIRTKHKRAGSN